MNIIDRIKEKLGVLNPVYLEVIDESLLHSNHTGMSDKKETHVRVKISMDGLQKEPLIMQHRTINSLLQDEFKSDLHALTIVII